MFKAKFNPFTDGTRLAIGLADKITAASAQLDGMAGYLELQSNELDSVIPQMLAGDPSYDSAILRCAEAADGLARNIRRVRAAVAGRQASLAGTKS